MGLSYEFSIGSVRAKENNMLNMSNIEHMLSLKDVNVLASYLSDLGYGDGNTVDDVISSHQDNVWKYIKSVAPDFSIFNSFIFQNDAHNLKTVLKGVMTSRDYSELIVTPNTINIDTLIKAVENRKFTLLPQWLQKPADRAYEVIAHTSDARLSDAIIDKATMEQMLSFAKTVKTDFVLDYFNTMVFYNNIKIAIRGAKTNAPLEFFNEAFCEVDGFSCSTVANVAVKGIDSLIALLEKLGSYNCKNVIESYKQSATNFEKDVDNILIKKAKECCKCTNEGANPLIGYLIGNMAEQKVIHIIACGIRTQSNAETIRERLREIYG